ncbi:MAG: NADP-dependent oxidoreductase [Deltaproteobacteria bacterium]|nr:MAG: NADP-dependent oxidoreductase [Deltaproteobacteria bacterium]
MKAIAINEFGGRDTLQLMNLPVPEIKPGEILVRVKAAGINPVDWKIREGYIKDLFPYEFPIILGWDAAGIVEQAGPAVTRFRQGDEIFAYCRKPMVQGGAYAEYIVLEEEHAAIKPKNISFEEAASIPLAALTAYQSLFDAAKINPGETVLIHAAAGGVGGFGVQLAKDHGAVVWGTASGRNEEYVQDLGATQVVDYNHVDFRNSVRSEYPDGVDVVFDCVGGEVLEKSADIVNKGGRLISIVDDPTGLIRKDIDKEFVFVAPNSTQLTELARMVEQGRLKTRLSQVFPFGLEEARRAHELSESSRTRGKMVFVI